MHARASAHTHTRTFSNLSGSKASAVATGPKVGVKLGVEKIPARPCAGRDVGRGSVAAVVSLVTVSLETERADGNTLVSVLGGFGCLVFASIGWVGSGSVDGVDRRGGGCKGRRGEETGAGQGKGEESVRISGTEITPSALSTRQGIRSYVHAYVRMYKCMWTQRHNMHIRAYVRTQSYAQCMYMYSTVHTYRHMYVCNN